MQLPKLLSRTKCDNNFQKPLNVFTCKLICQGRNQILTDNPERVLYTVIISVTYFWFMQLLLPILSYLNYSLCAIKEGIKDRMQNQLIIQSKDFVH